MSKLLLNLFLFLKKNRFSAEIFNSYHWNKTLYFLFWFRDFEQLKIPSRKSQERTSKTRNLKPQTDEGFSLQLLKCSIFHHSKDINTGLSAVPSTNNDIHYADQEVGRTGLLSVRCNKETRGRRWGEIAVRDCRNLSSFLP